MEEQDSVYDAARELYVSRHYAQAVAACRDALETDPEDVDVRLLLAAALMALRRDNEAQVEVAAALRMRPRCPDAYRMLGELAFRRDELRAAEIFLREALRARPSDEYAVDLLHIVQSRIQPAAAAAKLPAASAAAGPFFQDAPPTAKMPRLAQGTEPVPFQARDGDSVDVDIDDDEALQQTVEEKRKPGWILPKTDPGELTVRASNIESVALQMNPGLSGFGEYLVTLGVLTRFQLYCALHLQDWKRLRLGDAVVRLGFADPEVVAQAARAYHDALGDAKTRAVA